MPAGGYNNRMGLVGKRYSHTPRRSAAALSRLVEVVAQEASLKITGSAIEMPVPLKNDVFSRCSSHATRCQYHCR